MTDQIQELLERSAKDLIANNASGIAQELSDAPDGVLTVGLSFKLVKMQSKIASKHTLSFARKFKDEEEDSIDVPDPNQPELKGVDTVTITTPGHEPVTLTGKQFSKLANK